MNITDVRLTRLKDSKTLALASITLDNEFVVSGLKVLDGQNGIWVSMPSRKDSKNEYHDIAFPITKEARIDIQRAVLDKFNSFDNEEGRFTPPPLPSKDEPRTGYEKVATSDVSEDTLPF